MKTSFEKFMASSAVNKVELGKAEMINVQLGAKEDLIKLINDAAKSVAGATKIEDETAKFSQQFNAMKTKVPDLIAKNKATFDKMFALKNSIDNSYAKFQAQLKALGVPKEAVADLEKALASLKETDFYSLQRDLEFNTKFLEQYK
jgi:fructose-specific phosphotransferase system component IIB